MRRLLTMFGLAIVVASAITVFFFGDVLAVPPESEELNLPVMSPGVITPNIPTFVTFTTEIMDLSMKRVKLQFFNRTKGKWKTIGKLRDDGKGEDYVPGDRTFTLRLRLLESAGVTEVALPRRDSIKLKGQVTSPLQVRVVAKKRGQRGRVTSPQLTIESTAASAVMVEDPSGGPSIVVTVPPTVDVVESKGGRGVGLVKTGPDGYRVAIRVRPNPEGWNSEQWILACVFGPCMALPSPGEPQAFVDYPRELNEEPVTIAGLTGYRLSVGDIGGETVFIVLDDPTNQRIIEYNVFPEHAGQAENFDVNLQEALSIIQNLQP